MRIELKLAKVIRAGLITDGDVSNTTVIAMKRPHVSQYRLYGAGDLTILDNSDGSLRMRSSSPVYHIAKIGDSEIVRTVMVYRNKEVCLFLSSLVVMTNFMASRRHSVRMWPLSRSYGWSTRFQCSNYSKYSELLLKTRNGSPYRSAARLLKGGVWSSFHCP